MKETGCAHRGPVRASSGRPGESARSPSTRSVVGPDMELVGVWVHSPEKVGKDAGELAGGEPMGVVATNDADALIAPGARLRGLCRERSGA